VGTNLNVPYSAQYTTITREGHERPTPIFGAPTLVWHLGISPHVPDEHPEADTELKKFHESLAGEYQATRDGFFQGVNRLLELLQQRAGFPQGQPQTFNPNVVPPPWPADSKQLGEPFLVVTPTDIRFTLWWRDDNSKPHPEPTEDALRVRVHVAAHRDFVTVSFYLDAGKPWNKPAVLRGQSPHGQRRQRIFSAVESIQNTCEGRLRAAADGSRLVDDEVLPEEGVSDADAKALMGASRYLYTEIWDEFCTASGITDLNNLLGKTPDGQDPLGAGRVFANFRGLVASTSGLDDAVMKFSGSVGTQPFPRFGGNGGLQSDGVDSPIEGNESNAVVKAFWPFIRRITPFADQREFIACGVMNWRALYMTALGSPRAFDWREEGDGPASAIVAGHLPEDLIDASGQYDSLSGKRGEGPLRYLFLTKGEPHRRQIGRIVERINAMGTLRLVALRDWTIIRDASTQIQLRGLELDTIMKRWSEGSREIRDRYEEKIRRRPRRKDQYGDERDEALQELATKVEKDLIYLSAALDSIGLTARHGVHFRINRSRFYVDEFLTLLASLKVGNIDTWVAYDQFVARGLKPAFDFIDGVGTRLRDLRARLQGVLEGIETSALVIQTSATRSNTAQLKRIAKRFTVNNILFAAMGLALTYLAGGGKWQGVLQRLQEHLIRAWEFIKPTLDTF
jgi:Protein of unknown function (DUF3422)